MAQASAQVKVQGTVTDGRSESRVSNDRMGWR